MRSILECDDSQWHFLRRFELPLGRTHFVRPSYNLRAIQTIKQITNIVPSIPYPNIVASQSFSSLQHDLFPTFSGNGCYSLPKSGANSPCTSAVLAIPLWTFAVCPAFSCA